MERNGKTTYAKSIRTKYANQGVKSAHYEADDSMHDENGIYRFDSKKLKGAHEFCQACCDSAMFANVKVVIVSNTFTRKWEMQPYLDMAERYGYQVETVIMTGNYENVHGVPTKVVEKQKERFEY